MVQLIASPNGRALLPPLLACLPTAFVSPRPPPALLPLLSPVLSQRVQLLSANTSRSDNWLRLLCWDDGKAQRLPEIVEEGQFEPHPASGEIELREMESAKYRKVDEETLQAKFVLRDFALQVIYLWCVGDESEWRVAELRPLDEADEGAWYQSMREAEEGSPSSQAAKTLEDAHAKHLGNGVRQDVEPPSEEGGGDDDDDDDYWQQYDRSPGNRGSPAIKKDEEISEQDYYSRYSQVQPAMDNDENAPTQPGTKGYGGEIDQDQSLKPFSNNTFTTSVSEAPRNGFSDSHAQPETIDTHSQATPVETLEIQAATQTMTEVGVKQHLSTSLKSLYRLSKAVGIDREEFDRMVRTELETLSLMDEDS